MQLVYCRNCEHWCLLKLLIPNKQTGIADEYCEDCLPDEHRPAFEKYKNDHPEEFGNEV